MPSLLPLRITKKRAKRRQDLLANIVVVALPWENLASLLFFFTREECFLSDLCFCVYVSPPDVNGVRVRLHRDR